MPGRTPGRLTPPDLLDPIPPHGGKGKGDRFDARWLPWDDGEGDDAAPRSEVRPHGAVVQAGPSLGTGHDRGAAQADPDRGGDVGGTQQSPRQGDGPFSVDGPSVPGVTGWVLGGYLAQTGHPRQVRSASVAGPRTEVPVVRTAADEPSFAPD
ncbi:hypothetical protein [Thermomonospora umbrina]|uniref:hypothetical protein n=1 Tax=Thermomonospora umbrina TaxID=111806 RepID=UPI0011C11569|nr:hypothetical protein [Thermomonospora umbrina]